MTIKHIENPDIVDVNNGKSTTIILNDENIVINITRTGIMVDFWHDDSDGDPHGTVEMTFNEWREFMSKTASSPMT